MFLDHSTTEEFTSPVPDITEVIQTIKRNKVLLAKLMAAFIVVGTVIVVLIPSKYRAYATLVLNEQSLKMTDFQSIVNGAGLDNMSVKTEEKILGSAALAERTIETVDLLKYPEYDWAKDTHEAISVFQNNLNIYTQNASRAIEVAFTSKNPKLAADVANAHATAYINAQVEFKKDQMEKLRKWFEVKVLELKEDALKKSQAVQDYRVKENLVVGKDNKELIYQQISDVAGQLVPVEVDKYGFEAKSEAAGDDYTMTDVVNSPLVQKLKEQEAVAAKELGALQSKYGPRHPKVLEAQSQVAELRQAIKNAVNTITNSMHQGKESTEEQERLLKTRLASLNKEANHMRDKMIVLESLQVEADASKKILDNFLKNYEDIQSQASFTWPDATLVSPAIVPTKPIAPGKKLLMALVVVFSACMSLGIMFALELTRSGLMNFADIRKLSQTPLGIIPVTTNPMIAIKNYLKSSYKEAIKRIYMNGLMNNKAQTILVTSAMPKEGRTCFTVSMAYYMRSLGHRVLVVDADFLRPSLSYLSANPKEVGLADVLAEKLELADALDKNADGIFVLRAGTKSLYSPDILKSSRLSELMKELKRHYDYVLVDAGPMLAHSEPALIGAQVDGIIVIAEWLKTSQKNLSNLFTILYGLKTPVLGIAMNKVDIDKYKTMSAGSDFLLPKAANAA